MISAELLNKICVQYKAHTKNKDIGMKRDNFSKLPDIRNYAMIISGVRRCGKSTLLLQLLKQKYADAFYLNFDDIRLFDFQIADFRTLDDIIEREDTKVLMFDEIQLVVGWERYVRQKLDEGFKVFVTGSNASLLSRELGTSLTGRHITTELFPFSYSEFLRFRSLQANTESVKEYMRLGGFPEYIHTEHEGQLATLLDDILVRDIAVRYNIKDEKTLLRLTVYLLSNIGNLTTATKLKEPSKINSTATIIEYLSHLENSYLISLVPMFDYSLKKQSVNPKKIYAIDTGLVNVNVSKLKSDDGHKLENMVYNTLRRHYKEIYYHKGKVECDFLTIEKGEISQAIQVCYELSVENQEREFNGLLDALKTHHLTEGTIVTLSQKDSLYYENYKINIIPSWEFI